MWAAGPGWVVSTRDQTVREPVRQINDLPDGTRTYSELPFTALDQSEVDDDLDEILAHVGLPPRPRGYDWYLRIDLEQRDRIHQIGEQVEDSIPIGIDGADYLPAVKAAMELMVQEGLSA